MITFAVMDLDNGRVVFGEPISEAHAMVKDPVCGMMVDIAGAPKSEFKGKTYYFCSIDEKKDFDKAPANYIKTDKKETTKKQK